MEASPLTKLTAITQRLDRVLASCEERHEALAGRVAAYERALREAIVELEATREAFRSRRLRDLRLRIGRVLGEGGATT